MKCWECTERNAMKCWECTERNAMKCWVMYEMERNGGLCIDYVLMLCVA